MSFAAAFGKIRLTCIGASLTEHGDWTMQPPGLSYCDKMTEMLGDGYVVLNAGKSGHTMFKDGKENDGSPMSYWDTEEFTIAMNSKPDIVTIMLGNNDSKSINWYDADRGNQYALDYVSMIETVRALPTKPKVYALIPPPLWSPYPYEMQGDVMNEILPVLIRTIGSWQDVEAVDCWTPLSYENMTLDNCHCNDAGHTIIAETVVAAITADQANTILI